MKGAKPYLVPDGGITFGPWLRLGEPEWEQLPDALEGWDTGTDVRIRRTVQVDHVAVRGACALSADVPLVAAVSWTSSTTLMSELASIQPLTGAGELLIEAVLPGDRVGGVLDIRTTVSIGADWAAPAGVASVAGAILAETSSRLALEGTGSLFPVSVMDFSHTAFDADASWYLETSVDLDAPFLGRFLLSINSRDTELVAAVSALPRTPRQEALLSTLHHEVAELMLLLAFEVDLRDGLRDGDWPAESVGDVLKRTLLASDLRPGPGDSDPSELSRRRSQIEGSTRRSGHGRSFS